MNRDRHLAEALVRDQLVSDGDATVAHRHAFRALAEHVDDALPGIRKALLLAVASRRGSATG